MGIKGNQEEGRCEPVISQMRSSERLGMGSKYAKSQQSAWDVHLNGHHRARIFAKQHRSTASVDRERSPSLKYRRCFNLNADLTQFVRGGHERCSSNVQYQCHHCWLATRVELASRSPVLRKLYRAVIICWRFRHRAAKQEQLLPTSYYIGGGHYFSSCRIASQDMRKRYISDPDDRRFPDQQPN